MESKASTKYKSDGKTREPSIRYADDMVIILQPEDDATEILERINQFLATRGMKVSEKKTKITATTEGFDFLGWHFKVQSNGKFRCTPSVDNFKKFHQKLKAIVNCSNYGAKEKATRLAPIVRGWRNYHRFCKMDGSKNSLFHIETRALKVFNKETKQDRHSSKKLLNKAFPSVPYSENKFVNVKGSKSPYDGDMAYWSERNSKLYDDHTSRALKRQNHLLLLCSIQLRIAVNNAWDNLKDAWDNLPKIRLPEIDLPTVKFPDFELPRIELPSLDLPEFQLPDLKAPNFELPSLDDLRHILPDFKLPDWLIDFPPINPQEIQRQQDIEDIREREQERERPTEPDTEIRIRELIKQLDEGCVLFLRFARIRFRNFDKYESYYGRLYPLYTYNNWEPFKVDTDGSGNLDENKYEQLSDDDNGDSAEYLNSYYINASRDPYYVPSEYDYRNTYKYQTNFWREYKDSEIETVMEVQIVSITLPKTFRAGQEPDYSNLNYLLYNDQDKRYLWDIKGYTFTTNLNQLAFLNASSTCPIDLPPDKPVIPPLPPRDDMQCSCENIALIFRKTLQSMKYKIKVPIVSCELEEDRWLPKVAYKVLEVFAVDAATATSQAEVYREMAIQAKELCYAKNVIESVDKLSKAVGVDEYPASLPASLISEDEGFIGNLIPNPNIEVKNLTQLMGWFIERFDEVAGQFEIPIEIKDSDPTTPGDQPKGLKIPNIAEGIAEILGLLLQTTINSETLVSLATRTLIETGQDKQQNFKGYMLLEALIEYIGFNYEDKKVLLPMTFTPGKENLDEMLKETTIEVAVAEYNEKLNLQADFARYRRAAGILEARYFRKIDTNGDTKLQIMKYLKDAYDLAKKVNKNDDDDFEKFVEDAEIGFTNTPGVSDTQHPYGNSYSERPKIKDLSNNSNDNQQ